MHYFSTLLGEELYMFQTDLLFIIMGLNTVLTALGICHTVILKMDKIASVYTCTLRLNCKTSCEENYIEKA